MLIEFRCGGKKERKSSFKAPQQKQTMRNVSENLRRDMIDPICLMSSSKTATQHAKVMDNNYL